MKTKISLALFTIAAAALSMSLTACNDEYDYGYDALSISGAEHDPLVSFPIDDLDDANYYVTVAASGKVSEDITIQLAIDNSIVDEYNKINGTTYYAFPSADVELNNATVVIKAGSGLSNPATVTVKSVDNLLEGPIYVIPVTITSVSGGDVPVLEASKTILLRAARTIEFDALDMSSYQMYAFHRFPESLHKPLNSFTCEVKIWVDNFTGTQRIRRIANFTSIEEVTNMIRLGESGQEVNQLQWVSPGGNLVSAAPHITAGAWNLISLVFDGTTYRMYINGALQSSLGGTTGISFEMVEIGMCYGSYNNSQRLNGRMIEMRVWDRALGAREIGLGNCAVDPASNGLVAYWRFNENTGYVVEDLTGNGYTMDWSNVWLDPDGDGAEPVQQVDRSSYVRWTGVLDTNTCN